MVFNIKKAAGLGIQIGAASALVKGLNVADCPTATIAQAIGGNDYQVCPNTDLQGKSARQMKNCASTDDCVKLCSNTAGCDKAVYDKTNRICHIKQTTDGTLLEWVEDAQFDVIYVPQTYDVSKMGKWGDLIRLPIIPVAAYVVPEFPEPSRMMVFSSWGAANFGSASGYTQFADYNFKTGAVSERTVSNTHHDMFCPGISSLEDGRIIITGGSDAEKTSFYDPATNEFTEGPDMKIARGYQSSATLSNGNVFTIGGSYSGGRGGKVGEVFDPATNEWTLLKGADVKPMLTVDREGIWREDNHAWLYGWKNGSVFQAGPSKAQHWYGTNGAGSVTPSSVRDDVDAMCGINVMYEPGKIFSAGGAQDYDNSAANKHAHITTIDEPDQPATVERVGDMNYARAFSNAVVLPDGTVLITGGQPTAHVFTDTDGVLTPELFNPQTKTFAKMAPEAVARNYHSEALLLADGTVWSGGGGLCYVANPHASTKNCDRSVDHADGQIFSPPYLFNPDGSAAARPEIANVPVSTAKVGAMFTIAMNRDAEPATSFVLVRMGSATHSINTDQRRVPLTKVHQCKGRYSVMLPDDSGVLLPGYYYLFALSASGTPSMAKTFRVTLK
ncbi:hypothetical protein PG996_009997 [Apiospora saccharicola]|uniref:Apple domain-containing protein n=1 Tax=Apiospora saccharicola TaxID=335842 RepID=A0ABR1UN07_9PEZI